MAAHDDVGNSFIGKGAIVINGYNYNFGAFHHPAAGIVFVRMPRPLFADNWGGVSAYRGSLSGHQSESKGPTVWRVLWKEGGMFSAGPVARCMMKKWDNYLAVWPMFAAPINDSRMHSRDTVLCGNNCRDQIEGAVCLGWQTGHGQYEISGKDQHCAQPLPLVLVCVFLVLDGGMPFEKEPHWFSPGSLGIGLEISAAQRGHAHRERTALFSIVAPGIGLGISVAGWEHAYVCVDV
ncbi:hypothetical protein B0H14DRAFT_2610938 [Mycena olivaceomarginata]|nr:hypothetical protein B0H14DRAFT_2610938 [Mycena olivaceomarginata]